MTGTSRDMIDAWRPELTAEAAECAGGGDQLNEFRMKLLRRLESADFDTPVGWDDYRLLYQDAAGSNWMGSEALVRRARTLQVRAVCELAENFFSLAPNVRSEKWTELTLKTSFPPAAAWLERLEGGLSLNREPLPGDERQSELATCILDLFVLPPNQRMAPRELFLTKCRKRPREWRDAVRGLRAARPEMATLGQSLVKEILNLPARYRPFVSGVVLTRIADQSQKESADQQRGIPPVVAAIFILCAIAVIFSELPRSQPRIYPSDLYPKTTLKKVPTAPKPSQTVNTGKVPATTGKSPNR